MKRAISLLIISACVTALNAAPQKEMPRLTAEASPPKIREKLAEALDQGQFKVKDFTHLLGMPGFSNDLLKMHFKLYEGYVKNANLLSSQLKEMINNGQDRTPDFAGLKRMYGWEYDGMRLHEYYFGNLGGHQELDKDSNLFAAIEKDFGSYEAWKKDFVSTGLMRGIGWVILYQDPHTGRLTNVWINEHDVGHLAGNLPLLIMDVFEHAYITEYGLDRAKYIDAFFKNIQWEVVQNRYLSLN